MKERREEKDREKERKRDVLRESGDKAAKHLIEVDGHYGAALLKEGRGGEKRKDVEGRMTAVRSLVLRQWSAIYSFAFAPPHIQSHSGSRRRDRQREGEGLSETRRKEKEREISIERDREETEKRKLCRPLTLSKRETTENFETQREREEDERHRLMEIQKRGR